MTIIYIGIVLLVGFICFAIGGVVGYDIREKEEEWKKQKPYF